MSQASTRPAPAFAAAIATSPEPDAKSSTRPAPDGVRAVEHVARQRLPARPGEGPERRRQPDRAELLLGPLPQGGRLVGDVEADLRRVRHREQAGFRPDEGGRVRDHGARAKR